MKKYIITEADIDLLALGTYLSSEFIKATLSLKLIEPLTSTDIEQYCPYELTKFYATFARAIEAHITGEPK